MPDSAIRIEIWIRDLSERAVRGAPKLVGCTAIDGGSKQRDGLAASSRAS